MNNRGFTLIELMIWLTLFSSFLVGFYSLYENLKGTAATQHDRSSAGEEAREAVFFIVDELRQASKASLSAMPSDRISYRIPQDTNQDGTPLDEFGQIELSPIRTIMRDYDDANHDGIYERQLVLVTERGVRVLGNRLMPDEDVDGDETLGEREDKNRNNRLDWGIRFERAAAGVRVVLTTEAGGGVRRNVNVTLTETVVPRN